MKFVNLLKKKSALSLIIATSILIACNSSDRPLKMEAADTVATAIPTTTDWVSLFDGKTFAGWHAYGKNGIGSAWKVEDSVIHLNSIEKNGWQTSNGGDLVTDTEYKNFDLMVEWKLSKGGNSGIFFYVHEDPVKFKNLNQCGLEMQLNDDENNKNGMIEKQRAGDLVDLISSSSAKVVKPAGQWNLAEIRSDRGKLNFFINGRHTLSAMLWDDKWEDLVEKSKFKRIKDYGTYKEGRIALQDHGSDVWFRNIRIKNL